MLKNREPLILTILREAREKATKEKKVFLLPLPIKEILEMDFPDAAWLVDKLIPSSGISIISGLPASYKSWFIYEVARCVSAGFDLFGCIKTEKTGVLIMDEENGVRRLKDRMMKLDVDDDLPIFVWSMQEYKINEENTKKLIEVCEQKNIGLVIFDSLVRFHDQDENAATAVAKVFAQLRKCTNAGIATLLAHHNRKGSGGEDLSSAMRGSGDILAAIDSHIAITRKDKRFILTQTKSRDAEEVSPMEVEIVTIDEKFIFEYKGELVKAESKAKQTEKAVMVLLESEPNLDQKQILERLRSDGLDIGSKTLRMVLQEMLGQSVISRSRGDKNSYRYQSNSKAKEEMAKVTLL